MKRNFALAIIISILTLGLASCSEDETTYLKNIISSFENLNKDYDKSTFNSFEIKIINDIDSLHPDLQYLIERTKSQKGYLTFKGSDFSYPGITLVFISSGEKNTGGYNIEIDTIEENTENNELNIIIKETAPGPKDIVIQAITYPFILFTIEGEYDSFKIKDIYGNEIKPIDLKDKKSSPSENNNIPNIRRVNKDTINKIKAEALVQEFVDALNKADSKKILDCLNPEMVGYYTTETVEAAISDFKVYFKNSPVVKHNRIDSSSDIPNSYTYELISQSGNKININVIYNEDGIWIDCDFLNYSYQSKHLLERYIYALKKESKILLSQILAADNMDYPISNTSEIIKKYKEHFDLESLEYKFVEIDSENQTFIYHIIGEKNREPKEHAVKITYENKSVQIYDPWALPY